MEGNVRDQTVQAAFEILCETGPAKMRVQEVARRAGVSPTLLYYYFDGKHALIAAAYASDYAKILEHDRDTLDRTMEHAESMVTTPRTRGRRPEGRRRSPRLGANR
jgi:AcrR family transcriptional regulator